jgi:predicted peptidase
MAVNLSDGNSEWQVRYLIYLPQNITQHDHWPLLLFLHGSGQRGSDISDVVKHGPPALIAAGGQLSMIVVSPQCDAGTEWESERLLGLLDYIQRTFPVDPDRVYVSGFSMGGTKVWDLLTCSPRRFVAAVPVASYCDPSKAKTIASIPIWAFHGALDDKIPIEPVKQMIENLKTEGGSAELTILENQGHSIAEQIFSRKDVYDWLLKQEREE